MKPSDHHLVVIRSLQAVHRDLDRRFVGRGDAAALLVLAVVAREHMLLLGPPGTAKTELISRFAGLIQAQRYFSYLLTRFTEPAEIFGPLDFKQFEAGTYEIKTKGMLPDAEIAFLDEVFQGSSAILNTLLTLINERRFHNGAQVKQAPLISILGASSELPDDPALHAFSDRFLLRLQLAPVGAARLPELLDRSWEQEQSRPDGSTPPLVRLEDLTMLSRLVPEVDLRPVRNVLADLFGELLAQGITLSDRRIVRAQRLVAAATLLREDGTAAPRDLWPLAHLWTEPADAALVRDTVHDRVTADGGRPLTARRSEDELAALAEHEAATVLKRSGSIPRGSIVGRLRTINELLTEARTNHPAARQTHDRILVQRDRVSKLLEQTI